MKKTFFHLTLTALFLLTSASSCNKPKEPIEIPTGNHTFSCYIDGELFLPNRDIDWNPGGGDSDGLHFHQHETYFASRVYDTDNHTIYFNITDWSVGIFTLNDSNGLIAPSDPHNTNHAIVKKNGTKYLSKEGFGSVTFDEAEYPDGEVNGTFTFTLYNENDETDIIHVTNGKFNN